MGTNSLLKTLFNPQSQINQGEQIPPEQQVSEADMAQVPQVMGSPEGLEAGSEILKAGSAMGGYVSPLVGAGMYAAGTAIDPNKTFQEKTAPREIRNQLLMLGMGKMGRGAGFSDEVSNIAKNAKLSKAEAEILAERMINNPIKNTLRQIPTAVERHLDDWQSVSKQKGFELLKQHRGANLTSQEVIDYWKPAISAQPGLVKSSATAKPVRAALQNPRPQEPVIDSLEQTIRDIKNDPTLTREQMLAHIRAVTLAAKGGATP